MGLIKFRFADVSRINATPPPQKKSSLRRMKAGLNRLIDTMKLSPFRKKFDPRSIV